MRRHYFAFLMLLAFVLQSTALAQSGKITITPAQKKIAEGVTAKQMSDYLHFVASDEMEGRDTPSRGLDTTAKFIAMNLSRWGFKPAGDNGTYFQKIELTSESIDPAKTTLEIGGTTFKLNEDYYRASGNGTGSGKLVFGGNGWMVKSKGIDALAGVDVKGKIVVIVPGDSQQRSFTPRPDGVTEDDLKGQKGVDWDDPMSYAASKGAAGVIVVANSMMQGFWPQLRGFLGRGSTFPTKLREDQGTGSVVPVALVSKAVADAIFAGESVDPKSGKAAELSKTGTVSSASHRETKWTQNVVAIYEGSDPTLKNEMVAIGAHYDHIGMNPNAPGDDKINNGADDDGSGTVAVLSIAEALATANAKPKRSVLFVWHCGEEKGLWGSQYFNKFPTVDIKNVIAQLNIDMIGRSKKPGYKAPCDINPRPGRKPCNEELSGENAIYIIGSEMMSSALGNIVQGTNTAYLKLDYDKRYDDPKDPNRFFFRSDHFNYAVNGIPITFWFDGEHEDYHGLGDEPDKIDYQKMEKVARTILITLLQLTDVKSRPTIDKQLPPELTQR